MILPEAMADSPAIGGLDLSACRVLIIDDSAAIRQLIEAFLKAAGIPLIEHAANGLEGLAKIETFEPDLVILDIVMPGIDGFEVCRRLRGERRTRSLPVLVETALDSGEDRSAVFTAGATDVVSKPIHGPELVARVRIHLENRLLIRSLEDHVKLMTWEMELARYMQENLLPRAELLDTVAATTGLVLEAHFKPSSELGGDLWSVHSLGAERTGISIIDFTGHGLSSALNTFRLHALMNQSAPDPEDPAAYLAALNAKLVDLLPSGQFATMFLAVVDSAKGRLTYAGAGTPSPILCNPAVGLLDGSGLPLGISLDARYQNHHAPFPEGSVLFLYSDALIETPDRAGHCLDSPSVANLVEASRREAGDSSPLRHLIERFLNGRALVGDDLTLIWGRQGAPRD